MTWMIAVLKIIIGVATRRARAVTSRVDAERRPRLPLMGRRMNADSSHRRVVRLGRAELRDRKRTVGHDHSCDQQ